MAHMIVFALYFLWLRIFLMGWVLKDLIIFMLASWVQATPIRFEIHTKLLWLKQVNWRFNIIRFLLARVDSCTRDFVVRPHHHPWLQKAGHRRQSIQSLTGLLHSAPIKYKIKSFAIIFRVFLYWVQIWRRVCSQFWNHGPPATRNQSQWRG